MKLQEQEKTMQLNFHDKIVIRVIQNPITNEKSFLVENTSSDHIYDSPIFVTKNVVIDDVRFVF